MDININLKINNIPVIGSVKQDGIVYYIDKNKSIYTKNNDEYNIVTDNELIKKIMNYITPKPIDVI